jgi:hypothetical protein
LSYLCSSTSCRKISGHTGKCNTWPTSCWSFLGEKDKDKLSKAGYATPRGGKKGAYQNHVYRNNKVIIPYEKATIVDLSNYEDGYIVRLYPDQAFKSPGTLKCLTLPNGEKISIGNNAFVLYRSHQSFENFPPLKSWQIRHLENSVGKIEEKRVKGVIDKGHYILRLPKIGGGKKIIKNEVIEGPPQGIFAPEYANKETNFLSQVSLVWQIIHTASSPYTSTQANHLKLILDECSLSDGAHYNYLGMMKGRITTCPLCLKQITYSELHSHINLENEDSLLNSGLIVKGTNRSTTVNLFHLVPLEYEKLHHSQFHVAWGHATCNTKLGQRRCYSLEEVKAMDIKVAKLIGDSYETFGWISEDDKMIRSPSGAVWIRISEDYL